MSSPNPTSNHSQIPTKFRAISRNNSNTSTASSSNKGDFSSTISTADSATSGRSQIAKHQTIDHRQLLAQCTNASSSPIRSFQRATISSVVKTRAFDNDPVLRGLLASAAPSGQPNSLSNSQTPSPHSTPVFSRSRSLRMSEGQQRYQLSPSHYRATSRTPELYSFNNSDMSNCLHESQVKLAQLSKEKLELNESLEFLECERQVLIDSSEELKETLKNERSHWKKEIDDLKRQLTDAIASRIRAESQLTRNDMEMSDSQVQQKRFNEQLAMKDKQIESLEKSLKSLGDECALLRALNDQYKNMLLEKLKYNGLMTAPNRDESSECLSIVTELARLRVELNEYESREKSIKSSHLDDAGDIYSPACDEIETLNKFLDQTVECIKGWPEELAGSSHVQELMKTLLSAHRPDQESLSSKLDNVRL